jgi:replicative DNA helicase
MSFPQTIFIKMPTKTIFQSIAELYAKSEPADITTLSNALREKDKLEMIGGATYLVRLVDSVPIASNARHYAKIIKDKAILRRLIEAANNTVNQCFDNNGNVEAVINDAQKRMFDIDYKSEREAVVIGDAICSVIDKMEECDTKGPTGIKTGIPKLDLIFGGLQPSDSILLGGRPSMGKTCLSMNILRQVAIEDKIPSVMYSLEMSREQLVKRWISDLSRVDGGRILNNLLNQHDWNRITDGIGRMADAPLYIDDRSGLSYMEIKRSLRKMVKKYGIKFAVIDYLTLITGDREENRTREIGSISRAIKGMAKEFNIPIITICQLNRKCEERLDKRPVLADLRESGEIEQDADIVMFVYRDEVYNTDENNPNRGTAEILIRKHRNGAIGSVTMAFLKSYQRFESLATSDRYGDYS